MSIAVAPMELPPSTVIRLTGKQKLAMSLRRAGYSREFIAERMGIKHPESVSRLISQAKAAEKAIREAAMQYLEMD